jgi:GNAT superfamily N-acetyltransferase
MKLRPFVDADFSRMVELRNLWEPEGTTEEMVRDRDKRFPPEGVLRRAVAESSEGVVIGYSETARVPHRPPGEWWMTVTVDIPWRRQGAGTLLARDAVEFARAGGAAFVCDYIRESDEAGIGFANSLGAVPTEHVSDSCLNPQEFDETPYLTLIENLEAEGIRFFTFAETAQDEAAKRLLHEIYVAAERDMPHSTPDHLRSYEDFERGFIKALWWDPAGCFLAAEGDRWIGVVGIAISKPGTAFNEQSGIVREARGRGIATALKVLSLRWCRAKGVEQLRTSNYAGNDPMLAINRKLGYISEPGWLRYDLTLEGEDG